MLLKAPFEIPAYGTPVFTDEGLSTGSGDTLTEPIWVIPTNQGNLVTPVEDLVKDGRIDKSVLDALHQLAK